MAKLPSRAMRIEAMKKEIERRGGIVGIAPDAPEEITELFLMEVLACPDCMREAEANRRRREH